ncbi:MAG: O-antigen ligase family protein [Clostridia bacterium]|nr:O-antigen ligase family protein [Clostridia bacterium]
MVLLLFLIPIIAYLLKREFIISNMLNSLVFIIVLMVYQEYDIPFPAFILTMAALFLLHYRKYSLGNKPFNVVFTGYLAVMLAVNIVTNISNYHDVFAVFMIHLLFPFAYLYLDGYNKPVRTSKHLLLCGVAGISVLDLSFSLTLLFWGSSQQATMNHHPIGGGLAVAFLPLLIYLWSEKYCDKGVVALSTLAFGTSVILSGIRGYILIFTGTFVVAVAMNLRRIMNFIAKRKLVFLVLILAIGIISVLGGSKIAAAAREQTRMDVSLGRRTAENDYTLKLLENRSIRENLFGQGIGRKVRDIRSVYDFDFYMTEDRNYFYDFEYSLAAVNECISFHNNWSTIAISTGFCGLMLYLCFFIKLIKKILFLNGDGRQYKILLITYLFTLVISLAYRETLFRGVLEIVSLYIAIALKTQAVSEEYDHV